MSEKSAASETKTPKRGSLRKMTRGLVSLTTFSMNVGLAAAAVMIGVTTIQMRAEEKPAVAAAPLVEVRSIAPEFRTGYDVSRSFVGRIEPARRTDLGFELSGTIREIAFDEGDTLQKGDVIAVLDTRALEAEKRRQIANRRATESDRELAALTLQRRQQLRDGGHVSDQILDEARLALTRLDATIDQIDAAVEAIDISLDKSVLTAPFDGTVGERLLDEGATVSPGAPVLRLLETAKPTVRIGLAPEVVDRLKRQEAYEIRVAGSLFEARLSGFRPDLQTSTRTIETLFELQTSREVPQFGRLAELGLTERIDTEGYWVPTSALKEGPRGLWTLLAIVETEAQTGAGGYEIRREAVEVLHADADRSFVRGTISAGTQIVAEGVHRVVVGQKVNPIGEGA
ncbi:efflux RND transporter periplasmic adaptor subunit [Roseibium sp. HPY-6]|uniref:efflux RND transporter periplasmic adaptor subunit n=1 Tax=Roseibium sp. HPY-6 TaxID=3229852 RepID=UPI00338F13A5